jgi:hypothetical protein
MPQNAPEGQSEKRRGAFRVLLIRFATEIDCDLRQAN